MKSSNAECDMDKILEYISVNKEKYYERFCIQENSRRKFNFCAALLTWFWLPFHFMFLEWAVFLLIEIVVDVVLNLLTAFYFSNPTICRIIDIVNLVYFAALIFFWGFCGDRLLMKSIKRKIDLQKKGRADWIKKIYMHEKVMLFRVTAMVVAYGVAVMIMQEIPQRFFSAIVY